MSKFSNTILESMDNANSFIEDFYRLSRMANTDSFTETEMFPWGDRSLWLVTTLDIGTYLFYLDGKLVYAGQGWVRNRIGESLKNFKKYTKEYGPRKVPWKKSNEDWVVAPKMYNMCRSLKRWEIKCVIFHTPSARLNKQYAKNLEDFYIIKYNLLQYGLNVKMGDNT
jgi:hypothetical protein